MNNKAQKQTNYEFTKTREKNTAVAYISDFRRDSFEPCKMFQIEYW